jgi:hypothetical protein
MSGNSVSQTPEARRDPHITVLKKIKGELAILLNFKNNVLPWSEVTRVAGEQYPAKKHLFRSDRMLRSMVLSEGSKENKRNETSSAKCLKRNLVGGQAESGVGFDTREQE